MQAQSSIRRVAIIEDDFDIRTLLTLVLAMAGYEVYAAANGQEALDHLHGGFAADLILLDLMMPVMNGWEFRDAQRADPALADVPVVVLSGDGSLHAKAAGLGVAGYLRKPVDLDELERTVKTLCRSRS